MNEVLAPSAASTAATTAAPATPSRAGILIKKQLIVLFLLVAVRCFTLYAIPDEVESAAKVSKLTLSNNFGPWHGKDIKVSQFVYDFLKPEAIVQKRFTLTGPLAKNADGIPPAQIEVLAIYTRDPEGFHPPDVCMTADGWEIVNHDERQVLSEGKSLNLEVITGEQRGLKKVLAYCFTDPTGAVSGRTITFANMVLARLVRRRVGTVEVQFAYDSRVLLPNGEYRPEFKKLMVETAASVYRQLGTPKPSPESAVRQIQSGTTIGS